MRGLAVIMVAASATAASADPRPTLDDFFERTRTRDDGFGDADYLLHAIVGGQTATPSTLAVGARFGVEAGVRGRPADMVRTKLWLDVLRVNATGVWITDAAWQLTAFRATPFVHLSFDSLVGRRTELGTSEVIELQRDPYDTFDAEAEAAAIGPKIDKDASISFALGVANRLRRSIDSDAGLERRTAVSGVIAARAFAKGLRTHAQLDFARLKYTNWDVVGGTASAFTLSTGYQRLPVGLDTLPLWVLVGYEWAGERQGAVIQTGMDLTYAGVTFAPELARHLELDPATAMFHRVTSGRIGLRHTLRYVAYGATYEAGSIEDGESFQAFTPQISARYQGFELGVRCRFTTTPMLANRFSLALDRGF